MKKTVPTVGGLMVIELGVGMALGSAMNNMPVYMALGIVLGLLFGVGIDMSRRKQQADTDKADADSE